MNTFRKRQTLLKLSKQSIDKLMTVKHKNYFKTIGSALMI